MRGGRQLGASLVSVLMGVGILGGLAAATASYLGSSFSAQTSLSQRGDIDAIRRTVLNRISCNNTIARLGGAAACTGGLVDVYDRQDRLLIARTGTRLGTWTLRARCDSAGLVYPEIARLKPGASVDASDPSAFHVDALNGNVVQSWASMAKSFFPPGVSPCEAGSGGAGPSSACTLRSATRTHATQCFVTVACLPGEKLLSGGCSNQGCSISISRPDGNGWRCAGYQDWTYGVHYSNFTSTAYATCCK